MVYGGWEEDGLKEGEGGGGGDALSGVTAAGSPKLQSLNRGTENLASPTARRMLGGEHAAVIVDVRIPATNNIENNGLSILVDRYSKLEEDFETRGSIFKDRDGQSPEIGSLGKYRADDVKLSKWCR